MKKTYQNMNWTKHAKGLNMTFSPSYDFGSSRTGIIRDITAEEIRQLVGFGPNVDDDPWKVVNSWAIDVRFQGRCTTVWIWDYNGSHLFGQFSTDGDTETLEKMFGDRFISETYVRNDTED